VPVPNVQWITPDDGQGNCPKHVEFRARINLEISASVGFTVKKFITLHGHMDVKFLMFIHAFLILPDTTQVSNLSVSSALTPNVTFCHIFKNGMTSLPVWGS
jgi:hypothetical protein